MVHFSSQFQVMICTAGKSGLQESEPASHIASIVKCREKGMCTRLCSALSLSAFIQSRDMEWFCPQRIGPSHTHNSEKKPSQATLTQTVSH